MAVPERAASQVKVRVGEAVMAAYAAVFGRLGLALEVGWLPLLVMLAAALVPGIAEAFVPGLFSNVWPLFIAEIVVGLLCLNAFSVRWYQAQLFPNARALPRRLFVALWMRFVGYTLLFSVPTAAPGVALFLAGASPDANDATRTLIAAVGVLGVATTLGVLRLALVWPAAAYGAPIGFREAWRRMHGNTWRLTATMLLVSVPLFITIAFALHLLLKAVNIELDALPSPPPLGLVLLMGVADTVWKFLLIALGAAVLAQFYRRLVRDMPVDRSKPQ